MWSSAPVLIHNMAIFKNALAIDATQKDGFIKMVTRKLERRKYFKESMISERTFCFFSCGWKSKFYTCFFPRRKLNSFFRSFVPVFLRSARLSMAIMQIFADVSSFLRHFQTLLVGCCHGRRAACSYWNVFRDQKSEINENEKDNESGGTCEGNTKLPTVGCFSCFHCVFALVWFKH